MFIEPAEIDETTQQELVEAAELALGKKYKISDRQRHHLIAMHRSYLTPRGDSIDYSKWEIHTKKAEEATKRYFKALRKCGHIGEVLTKTAIEPALRLIQHHKGAVEYEKEICQEDGFPDPYTQKQGNPGNIRLRSHITQMAYWYEEVVGKKPASGDNSIFPRLISACLAIFDESWLDKKPPRDIVAGVLIKPPTFPRKNYDDRG